jgi:hypothetical protein
MTCDPFCPSYLHYTSWDFHMLSLLHSPSYKCHHHLDSDWEMMKKKEYFHHLDLMKVVRNHEEKNSTYLLFVRKLQLALFPLSQSHVLCFKLHHLSLHQRCDDDWWRKELCHHLDLDQSCVGEWWRKRVASINFAHLAIVVIVLITCY